MMDLENLRTFLTLAEVKRLSLCAEQLCLTKSALSARIRQLEQQLGVSLFQRTNQGMLLTKDGQQFYPHALAMQQRWHKAKQQLQRPIQQQLRIASHPSLANNLLLDCCSELQQSYPQLELEISADYSKVLTQQLSQGQLDIALVFLVDSSADLQIQQIWDDQLIMLSSEAQALHEVSAERYLYLDWGWGYNAAHAQQLPQLEHCQQRSGFADMGLPWLLRNGGSAYLPARLAQQALQQQQLFQVKDAPVFSRPIFAAYRSETAQQQWINRTLDRLQQLAQRTA